MLNKAVKLGLNGIGVFEPSLAVKFYKYYKDKQLEKYTKIIEEVEEPFFKKCVEPYSWHLSIKAALEARGFMSRHERMPMLSLDAKSANIVSKFINSLKLDSN